MGKTTQGPLWADFLPWGEEEEEEEEERVKLTEDETGEEEGAEGRR